ncbi:MAG: DNA polymerase ligase N-terminal domain-containing protein [Promethearchaeota archaeon]|nr:MAG: DNA polymerase ligase D [Helarchaeota virus Nidhogg Meg22_1012]URC17386.1 MAG: transcription factor S [Helarchaeota virus Nidhogg Meg22_1214]
MTPSSDLRPKISLFTLLPYVIQEHKAKRAGLHYDFRVKRGENDWESWAIRKGFPKKPGIKHLAAPTPSHDEYWAKFSGVIPRGYGSGRQKVVESGKIDVIRERKKKNKSITFKKGKDYYTMIKLKKGKNWLIFKNESVKWRRTKSGGKFPKIDEMEKGMPKMTNKQYKEFYKRMLDLGLLNQYKTIGKPIKQDHGGIPIIEDGMSALSAYPTAIGEVCPKCGHPEIKTWQRQTRSADEPMTQFFRCVRCGYTWREYD